MFTSVGPAEIALVLLVVVLLFGARRLPEVGRSLGQSLHGFSTELRGRRVPIEPGSSEDRAGNRSAASGPTAE
jgi:sec-independent protein translocase protein TatA